MKALCISILVLSATLANFIVACHTKANQKLMKENMELNSAVSYLEKELKLKGLKMNDKGELGTYTIWMYYYKTKSGKRASLEPIKREIMAIDIREAGLKFAAYCVGHKLCEKIDKDGDVCTGCVSFTEIP